MSASWYPLCDGHWHIVTTARSRKAKTHHAGGTTTMKNIKRKFRLFVLCHEYLCAVILSVFGAFLTVLLSG